MSIIYEELPYIIRVCAEGYPRYSCLMLLVWKDDEHPKCPNHGPTDEWLVYNALTKKVLDKVAREDDIEEHDEDDIY